MSVYKNLDHIFVSVKIIYIVTAHLTVLINSASVNSSRKDWFPSSLFHLYLWKRHSLAVESGQQKDRKVGYMRSCLQAKSEKYNT